MQGAVLRRAGSRSILWGEHFGELLAYERSIFLVGDDYYVFLGHKGKYAVIRHLKQRPPGTEKIYELFGTVFAGIGPETAADSTAHNHTVTMRHHNILLKLLLRICYIR